MKKSKSAPVQTRQGRGPRRVFVFGPVVAGKQALEFIRARISAQKLKRVSGRDLVIAVDGGLAVCQKLGLEVDLWVGDGDSLPRTASLQRLKDRIAQVALPQDKDRSDLWYAAREAVKLQAEELYCYGVSGGRPDHHQAMILDLTAFSLKFDSVAVFGPEADYYFIAARPQSRARGTSEAPSKSLTLHLKPGQIVSVFGEASRISYKGLKFKLQGGILSSSTMGSLGLSNRVEGISLTEHKPCKIELKKGHLLVVVPRL